MVRKAVALRCNIDEGECALHFTAEYWHCISSFIDMDAMQLWKTMNAVS
jgi:hypothetical protein